MSDGDGTMLVGRERELAYITAVVDAGERRASSVLLCGDPGIGKSALLYVAATHARRRGYRILTLTGAENRPFALLDELIDSGSVDVTELPGHLRHALATLRHPGTAGTPVDEPAVVTALLLVLEQLARERPTLVIADDLHRSDSESVRLLAEVLRHTSAERIVLLLAARDEALEFDGGDHGIPRYRIEPLSEQHAARLLDTRYAPTGAQHRRDILRRAEGNPLALRIFGGLREQLPPEFTERVRALPAATGWLLLHAALADGAEHVGTLTRAARASLDLSDWGPAELAGLIAVRNGHVHFRHPLIRAACAAGRSANDVVRAHRALAAATDDLYRRTWHLAESTIGRDDALAAVLEEAATSAASRGDHFTAAGALQSAAERSTDDGSATRRYARAVGAAYRSGHPDWTIELYEKTMALLPDADTGGVAACGAGLALMQSAQPWEAFEVVSRAVRRRPNDGQVALLAVFTGAAAVLASGVAAHREQLPALLALADDSPAMSGTGIIPTLDIAVVREAILAISDPTRYAASAACPEPAGTGPAELLRMVHTGTIAFLLDDSSRAANDLQAVCDTGSFLVTPGFALSPFSVMITALIDSGRWAEADRLLDRAAHLAAVRRVRILRNVVLPLRAILRALRHEGAADALDTLPVLPGTGFTDSLNQRAAGLAALAAGDHETAYLHFRRMFDEDGEPRHYFLGPRSLPQFALTAAKVGRAPEALRILQRCRQAVGSVPTSRMAMLLAHATALLDGAEQAEKHFLRAVEEPGRALHWPLEYAEAQLNYGLWLRSRRRIHDARPYLLSARETFLRLGAQAHAEQARTNLPVALRPSGETTPQSGAFTALTAQKQMIARMAAGGMSNRGIAERLFLSPRTVGSHLYRIYAELGVGNRHQLRALIEEATMTLALGS
ncbi:AAA family ATPase [Micromonospora sp. CA-240977]|uniref:helix-turn-helix transcriptional regulator n=1 Tax=Micromonospora sp. CA-240977 TaxID=3239957 RepID=UPI003D912EDC